MVWDEKYTLQTIKNNLPLITEEIMNKINAVVLKLGHKQFTKSKTKELKAKGDSFVMKTKVEYPTDIGLLQGSSVSTIMEIYEIAHSYSLRGYK